MKKNSMVLILYSIRWNRTVNFKWKENCLVTKATIYSLFIQVATFSLNFFLFSIATSFFRFYLFRLIDIQSSTLLTFRLPSYRISCAACHTLIIIVMICCRVSTVSNSCGSTRLIDSDDHAMIMITVVLNC